MLAMKTTSLPEHTAVVAVPEKHTIALLVPLEFCIHVVSVNRIQF